MLSLSMELLQFYDPGRVSAMSDVYTNTVGTLLGATVALASAHEFSLAWLRGFADRPFVTLLTGCYLGYRLFPYEPVIDMHKYWIAVRPLLLAPRLHFLDLYVYTIEWLTLAVLIQAALGAARSRWAFPLLAAAVLGIRILIVDTALSPSDVAGAGIAVAAWLALASHTQRAPLWLAPAFALAVAIQALQPFHFSSPPHAFDWIPFRAFIQGSVETGIQAFFEKAFLYGALVWLAVQAGWSRGMAALVGGVFVCSLRVVQVYLPGRSASITDPIMLLLIAGVMHLLLEKPTPMNPKK
jgi:VanZ family protein